MPIFRTLLVFSLLLVPACLSAAVVVSPAKIEALIDPGERQSFLVTVSNTSDQEVTIRASLKAVSPTDRGLSIEDTNLAQARPVPPFIDVPEPVVVIAPHEEGRIPIVFAPQAGTKAGSLATVLLLTHERRREGTAQAQIISRVAVPVLVTITGDLRPSGVLSFFNTANHRRITASRQLTLIMRFHNQGTVQVNPYGILTIRSLFGRIRAQYRVDPWYVLSDSERSREFMLMVPRIPGFYYVTLELNRGYQDIVDTRTLWIVYTPWWLEILVLLALSGLVFARIKHSRL